MTATMATAAMMSRLFLFAVFSSSVGCVAILCTFFQRTPFVPKVEHRQIPHAK